ncbi:NAD binding domain of 6-phosphogluconate dehydrogenase-domain-containing protein [Apiosordaria backusii]|uniref:NAD binding domain of 6-phosphogluconate dehydrogenase-domain-containing protein n=1 Tax=Apiosordaria backusii TaxID=314023 RepID=A0AA40BK78_9PEZI|nr:NAD binding domain of 6-phosphogluconate dehydrogenase-domain-containing protein [Apiosordaria backusii]
MAPRVLWIGLGNMGRGMVKNLVEKGPLDQPLLIYNRTKQRSIDLASQLPPNKVEILDSISSGVPQADIIFLILSKDDVVESAIAEILTHDIKGKLMVDCSTIHPENTTRIATSITSRGGEFLAAPVFGAPAMADAGQLIGVLAGPASSVNRARPYFKGVMAKAEIDMSDEPYGKALTLKLIGNTFVFNMVEQLAEGHVLAEKSGLGTKYLHQWVESMFPGPYAAYSTRMLTGDYHTREYPLFAVDLARKDAGHALRLAEDAGTRMRNLEVADEHLKQVKEHAGEMGDIAGIYGAVRKEAGLKYENS